MGLSEEYDGFNIGVTGLWPRTAIATAAVSNELGGDSMTKASRTDDIMGDSAYEVLTTKSRNVNGNFFIDDEVLASVGVTDFEKYKVTKSTKTQDMAADFFINWNEDIEGHLKAITADSKKK